MYFANLAKYKIEGNVQLKNLAVQIGLEESEIKKAMSEIGCQENEINTIVSSELVELILMHLKIPYISCRESESLQKDKLRPPVVGIVGHVDHGKTTLLDYLRKSFVAKNEVGGITQKISAFTVKFSDDIQICFIDTPGHSAFHHVRSCGIQATDLVVLIVSADDGVQEQTVECIKLIASSQVPFVVCITKIDKKVKRIDSIYDSLAGYGVEVNTIGGSVPVYHISSLTGEGVGNFLAGLTEYSKSLNLYCQFDSPAKGVLIDCNMNSSLGICTTAVLKQGILKRGDRIFCPSGIAKVRQIILENGKFASTILPSQPFGLVGWAHSPASGEIFRAIKSEEEFKKIQRNFVQKKPKIAPTRLTIERPCGMSNTFGKCTFFTYDAEHPLSYLILIKCDNYGSAEAIAKGIGEISDQRVSLSILYCGINHFKSEQLYVASSIQNVLIYAYNSSLSEENLEYLQKNNLQYNSFQIIYKLFDHVKSVLQSKLDESKTLVETGTADVLKVFNFTGKNKKTVYGVKINQGSVILDPSHVFVAYRLKQSIHQGQITSIKHYQANVTQVNSGHECGLCLNENFEVSTGDVLKFYKTLPDKRNLDWKY